MPKGFLGLVFLLGVVCGTSVVAAAVAVVFGLPLIRQQWGFAVIVGFSDVSIVFVKSGVILAGVLVTIESGRRLVEHLILPWMIIVAIIVLVLVVLSILVKWILLVVDVSVFALMPVLCLI